MIDAAPGRVLRLAVGAWGLGHLAMGMRRAGAVLLFAEAGALALVIVTTVLLADTTWYLVPFLLGMAFIGVWVVQAVAAYRTARRRAPAAAAPAGRSPAAVIAWLTLPLLVWGTGYWLIAGEAATPSAVLDRFVSAWPEVATATDAFPAALTERPVQLSLAARAGLRTLQAHCRTGDRPEACDDAPAALLGDVRFRIVRSDERAATAVAELVTYVRRPSRFLWVFDASELVPVSVASVLRLELGTRPAALGAARWTIVNATAR